MVTNRVAKATVKILAYLPVYTAIVVTLTLLMLIFGAPYIGRF